MINIRLRIEPQGDDSVGFSRVSVTLIDRVDEHEDTETFGELPKLPQSLIEAWKAWWLSYYGQESVHSLCSTVNFGDLLLADSVESPDEENFLIRGTPERVIRRRPEDIREYKNALIEEFDRWLSSERFTSIRERLAYLRGRIEAGQFSPPSQIILEFRDTDTLASLNRSIILKRLPWQEWSYLRTHRSYPTPAIVFRLISQNQQPSSSNFPRSSKIRILIIIGGNQTGDVQNGKNQNINSQEDLHILKNLEYRYPELLDITSLQDQDLTLRRIQECFEDQIGYHIFIYAGHSKSRLDGSIGWLELTPEISISIDDFRFNIQQLINKGMKLAIFNSCDGLGLARQILDLGLDQCIVMKDPVPDPAAIEFLKRLFENFACNQLPLSESVRLTCGALEHLDYKYPGVKWLPLILIKRNVQLLTWQMLLDSLVQEHQPKPSLLSKLWGLGKNTLGRLWDYASRLWARLSRRLGISLLVLLFVGALIASIAIPQIIPADVVIQPMSMEQKNALKNALKNKDKDDIGVLRTSYENNRNRPDMLIDLLNAIVLENEENSSVYKIGVIVEDYTGRDRNSSKEDDQTLRGIAQSQLEQNCGIDIKQLSSSLENNKNEFEAAILNSSLDELKSQCSGGKNDSILFYVAVDAELKETEDLTKEQALKITEQFSEDFAKSKDVAGVIGHSNSEKTFHAYDHAYGKNRVTLISPTSTAMRDLSGEWTWLFKRNYLFRTATNDKVAVSMLVNFIDNKLKSNEIKARKVGVVHESKELYSSSYVKIMKSELKEKGIDLIGLEPDLTECDINQKFTPSICVKKLRDQGAEVLLLVPGSGAVVKAQEVISANASYTSPFTYILGSDTMYKGAYERVQNALDHKQFLIAVPWARDREKPSDFEESARAIWGIGGIEWRTVTSYDAFKILAKATEKAIKEGDLTRLRLHKVLASSSNFSKSAIDENIQFFKENHDRNSSSLGVLAEFSSDETSGETFFKYN